MQPSTRSRTALKASEAHYRTLFEMAPDVIYVVSAEDGTFTELSSAFETVTGWSVAEWLGKPFIAIVHPDDLPLALQRFEQGLRGEIPDPYELRILSKSGTYLVGEFRSIPLIENGTVVGKIGIARDITERKRVEHTLRFLAEASTTFASSLDYEITLKAVAKLASSHIGDWCVVDVVAEDGSVQRLATSHVDPAKERWAQEVERRYPPQEPGAIAAVMKTHQSILTPDISDDMLVANARDDEHLAILRDMKIRSAMTVPLIARGRVLGAMTFVATEAGHRYGPDDLAVAEELCSRAALAVDNARLHQEAVRAATEREAMLGQMVEGVAVVDANGMIIFVNDAAARMVGVPQPATPITSYAEPYQVLTLDGSPHPPDQLPLARALRGETVANAEWRMRGADETEIVMQGSAAPVRTADGDFLGAVATFRDVTAQHELERQKEEFLSLVAHELRTPITVIRGFTQVLGRTLENTDDASHQRLKTIERQIGRLTGLIDDLLDVSRVQTSRFECECMPLAYVPVVQSVVDEMRILHEDREIRMSVPTAVTIVGDEARLRQVLVNLIDNALKYGPPGTSVTITAEQDGETVTTYVCDEGPPLPMEERERIFDRFYRSDGHRARATGFGIGLYVTRGIIEAHGGRIWVADDDHSSFAFSLTALEEKPTQPA